MARSGKRRLDIGIRDNAGAELLLLRRPAFLSQCRRLKDSTSRAKPCCPMKSMKEGTNKAMMKSAEMMRWCKESAAFSPLPHRRWKRMASPLPRVYRIKAMKVNIARRLRSRRQEATTRRCHLKALLRVHVMPKL